MPIPRRPILAQATRVVPLPMNGSRTRSPSSVNFFNPIMYERQRFRRRVAIVALDVRNPNSPAPAAIPAHSFAITMHDGDSLESLRWPVSRELRGGVILHPSTHADEAHSFRRV